MGKNMDQVKVGLFLGLFSAGLHAVWALCVAVMPRLMQSFLDWIVGLHFIKPFYILTPFKFTSAVMLVVMAFVVGFVIGWLLTALWNAVKNKF